MEGMMTIRQAAAIRKVSKQAVYLMVVKKRLPAQKVGKKWMVHKHDVKLLEDSLYSREYMQNEDGYVYSLEEGRISVRMASRKYKIPVQKLYYLIRKGAMAYERYRCSYIIDEKDVIAFAMNTENKKIL